jgi:hypothetical protein
MAIVATRATPRWALARASHSSIAWYAKVQKSAMARGGTGGFHHPLGEKDAGEIFVRIRAACGADAANPAEPSGYGGKIDALGVDADAESPARLEPPWPSPKNISQLEYCVHLLPRLAPVLLAELGEEREPPASTTDHNQSGEHSQPLFTPLRQAFENAVGSLRNSPSQRTSPGAGRRSRYPAETRRGAPPRAQVKVCQPTRRFQQAQRATSRWPLRRSIVRPT